MRHAPIVLLVGVMVSIPSGRALADPVSSGVWLPAATQAHHNPWDVDWLGERPLAAPVTPSVAGLFAAAAEDQATRRPVPVDYSDGYRLRAKIHKIASFATLPLFVAEYFVGQDMYNNPGTAESRRGVHGALAGSIGVLFGVNSVTGAWNLWEARKDPNHRTLRTVHGILMLVADAGFVATGALAPEAEEGGQTYVNRRSTHRTVALTSMGIATFSYLLMLFGGR